MKMSIMEHNLIQIIEAGIGGMIFLVIADMDGDSDFGQMHYNQITSLVHER